MFGIQWDDPYTEMQVVNFKNIDSLMPWVADIYFLTVLLSTAFASWTVAGYTAELAGCHADDAKNMEPARHQELNHKQS